MMSRSWIGRSRDLSIRLSSEYKHEVDKFMEFAFSSAAIGDRILCPCAKCINQLLRTKTEVLEHLVCDGFLWNYTKWTFHGEGSSSHTSHHINTEVYDEGETYDVTHTMLNDIRGSNINDRVDDGFRTENIEGANSVDGHKFDRLREDAEKKLYPGCMKFTRLSFILCLFHIKCLYKMTDKALSMLLDLLQEALPEPNTLPKNLYEAKNIIKDLGLNYNKIDACPNDCMLYWKDAEKATSCSKCGTSRYTGEKKIPAKTLRHFPLIPRLQRLYTSYNTSINMRWHHDNRTNDGRLRHPADGKAWKEFDKLHPTFGNEPRNIRLGLASDGFNPFKSIKATYSNGLLW